MCFRRIYSLLKFYLYYVVFTVLFIITILLISFFIVNLILLLIQITLIISNILVRSFAKLSQKILNKRDLEILGFRPNSSPNMIRAEIRSNLIRYKWIIIILQIVFIIIKFLIELGMIKI